MAAETEEKKEAQTEEKPAEKEKSKPEKPKKPPKERNLLLTFFTILFVLVGIAELGLLAYTGFGVFRGSQARRAYESQQAGLGSSTDRPLGSSYSGPGLIIENGEVVWRRVEDLTQSGFGSSSVSGFGSGQSGLAGDQTIPRGLWLPYPPPPWAREDPQAANSRINLTQPNQTPMQT